MSNTPTFTPQQVAGYTGAHQPTSEQAAVISAPLSPGAIVAGAGSGKTETMAARVVYLVCNGLVEPDRVLGLTFTRKAASELAERVRRRLREAARTIPRLPSELQAAMLRAEPVVLTYDSYARRIVQEHGLRLGIEPSVRTADAGALWLLAQRIVRSYDGPLETLSRTAPFIVDDVVSLSDEMAAHLVDLADLIAEGDGVMAVLRAIEARSKKEIAATHWKSLGGVTGRALLAPLLEQFARAKREADVMSFGDTLRAACTLATASPMIGELERSRYDVVLLDEYQDTSAAQARLLCDLFRGHPITAVGDPCQAIYGFRGASAGTLPRFRTTFGDGRAVPLYTLATSFRNDRAILDYANAISKPLLDGGANVAVLVAGPQAHDGEVNAGLFETVEQEAAALADDVARTWDQAPQSTISVLCRKRSDEFGAVIDALLARGLPVEVVGLSGLLSLREIREIVQTLTVLTRPDSAPELTQLLGGRRWAIGPADLIALRSYSRQLAGHRSGIAADVDEDDVDEASLVDALDRIAAADPSAFSEHGWQRLTTYAAELAELRSLMGEPLADLIGAIERTIGVDVEVTVRDIVRGAPIRAALDQFGAIAHSFSAGPGSDSAAAFLQYLDAAEVADRGLAIEGLSPRSDAVQVLTMHASKGLEWDSVYVVGAVETNLPGVPKPALGWMGSIRTLPYALRGDADALPTHALAEVPSSSKIKTALDAFKEGVRDRHEEEERRLMYVAATRARHRLWVSGAVWKPSATKPRAACEYLTLAREHVERSGRAAVVWTDPPTDDAENAALVEVADVRWPESSFGPSSLTQRMIDERQRADAASKQIADRQAARAARSAAEDDEGVPSDAAAGGEVHPWLEVTAMLLRERAARSRGGALDVEAPSRLSASQLVAIAKDPEAFALDVRRPVPRGLAVEAERGNRFHSWVEHRFGSDSLLDIDDLPGASDQDVEADASIDDLIAAFEASEWADRRPVETETGFDVVVDGIPLRGRLDAVFEWDGDDADYDVIDWKTGRRPKGAALKAAEVQLAVYRLAWARIKGIDPRRVRAGFFYVADAMTHRPARVLDESELIELVQRLPHRSG